MAERLDGRSVAILATDGVEQSELTEPRRALEEAGARTCLVSLACGEIQAMTHGDRADRFTVDTVVSDSHASNYDALLLPGGVKNPDTLRMDARAVAFARAFATAGKPIGAICHGPWLLVEADVLRGRRVTSYPSLKTDIRNAGGVWVDEEVVVDEGLVTSRRPDDLPAFCAKLVEEVAEGRHRLAGTALVDEASEQSFPASDAPAGPLSLPPRGAPQEPQRDALHAHGLHESASTS
jgi:protease I